MRYISISLALVGSLMLVALAQSEPPVTSGLLLGLRADGKVETTYRTLWIAPQRGQAKLLAQGKDVLVARASGWWRVGQGRYRDGSGDWVYDIDAPWAVPAIEKSWVGGLKFQPSQEKCGSQARSSLLFVGSDHVTLETDQGGYCEGAAHPWQWNGLSTYRLEAFRRAPKDWNDLGGARDQALKFQTIFPGQVTALRDAGRAFYARQNPDLRDRLAELPEDSSWGLVRRAGNWVVRGRLNYSSEAARGSFADFDVPASAPASFTGPFGEGFALDELRNDVPDATDFVLSPARDLVAIVRPTSLRVEHVWGGKPARKLALAIPLQRGESIVMAQWAAGRGLERWLKDVPALLGR